MKRLILLSVVILLCGCSPQKRLARLLEKFPLPTDTVIEYRDTTIYSDTILYDTIYGEIILDSILIPVEVDLPYMELQTASTLASARAWVLDNQLGLELIQYDTVFVWKLDSALRQDIDTVFIEIPKEVPVIEKVGTFWKHGFLVLAGLAVLGMILFFVLK